MRSDYYYLDDDVYDCYGSDDGHYDIVYGEEYIESIDYKCDHEINISGVQNG
jgi:hypothetical protein